MAADNDPPKNPFIRWKQHVDAHIGLALNGLLGIPTIVTKNLNIRRIPEEDGNGDPNAINSTSNNNSHGTSDSNAPATPQGHPPSTTSSSRNDNNNNNDDGGILDGVDAAQLLEWHKFIYYSPYSPLKLQQDQQDRLLPPPIPQDVPFGADPYAFTYIDAFEDLLRAASSRPLLDLTSRSYRNLRYQMRYGNAVEPPYVFFHRMHSDRLLDAYFPKTAAQANGPLSADTPSDNVVRAVAALTEREQRDPWRDQKTYEDDEFDDDYGHEDDGDDGDDDTYDWNRRAAAQNDDPLSRFANQHQRALGQGSLFDELDRVFRVLTRIIDEDTGVVAATNRKNNQETPDKGAVVPRDADAEDELYTAVRSAYANAEKSLSTFFKSLSGVDDTAATTAATTPVKAGTTTQKTAEGETVEKTTDDHVDMFGNRHVKTVVRRLDANGNEIARETHYSIRSPDQNDNQTEAAAAPTDDNQQGAQKGADAKTADTAKASNNTKTGGWFWK